MVYNKGKKAVYAAVVIIILNVILTVTAAAAGEILWYYPPTPQGNVGIRKPTILWTFSGLSSDQVREINMTVDGQKVDAVFRDDLNSVYYKPQRSLMPGRRRVSIVVTLKSGVRFLRPLSASTY